MPVDSSIATSFRPVQFDNPLESYQRAMTIKHLGLAAQDAQRNMADKQTLADIYKSGMKADGSPDNAVIVQGMADRGLGHMIPAYRKTMLDSNKDQAEIDLKSQQTKASEFEVTMKKLNARAGALQSLLSKPDLTHDDVVNSLVQLVQDGVVTPEQGQQAVMALPGNSQALRDHLMRQGLQVMEAAKRTELLAPKSTPMDDGQRINMGTTNQLTGQWTPSGQFIQKQVDPNTVANNTTSRLNNRDTNSTSRQNNADTVRETARGHDLTFQSANTKIEQTPNGFVVVNTATPGGPSATPIRDVRGAQVQQPNSPQYLAEQRFGKITESIKMAKDLLPGATGSGAGAMFDKAAGFLGSSTTGGDAAAQLETLSGWMTSNVPRMEGPQSNADVIQYKQMAADIGDRTKPISARLKALETLESLTSKYAKLNQGPTAADSVVRVKPPVPVKSDSDYDRLPAGTRYQDPSGNIRVKQ